MFLVLDKVPLKKSKIKSPFKVFTIFLLVLSVINVIININKSNISIYNNQKIINGKVIQCTSKQNKTQYIIKNKEKVLINYDQKTLCQLGSIIKVTGKTEVPKPNTNFFLFNYKNYLLSKNIKITFKAEKIEIIKNNKQFKYKIINKLNKKINNYKSKKYMQSLILGNNIIDEEIKESYQKNGISHLLAISGMHILILSGTLLFILNKILKNQNISYIVIMLFLIIYMSITNFTPSIVRAILMFIVMTIKKQLNLKIESKMVLILIFCVFLLINPNYIYNLGFLLSFITSFYIMLFNKITKQYNTKSQKSFVISLIAFLASSPIIINNFFSLNLLSPLINLVLAPLISDLIYPLSLISLVIKPADDILFLLITFFENISLKLNKINFLTITLCHINIIFIILYYILITFILHKWDKQKPYFLIFFLLTLIIHSSINILNPYTSLTMIDVGQGDSLLIKLKHNQGNILVDTGGQKRYDGKKEFDIAKKITIPYLKAEGIREIDYLILTHGDYDHMGQAFNLINSFKVDKVILNNDKLNELELKLIKILEERNIPYYQNIKKLNIGNNKLYFLNDKLYDNENDNSNVIYTKFNKIKLLLMGDAGVNVEKDILNKYIIENIDILKVGHHGSNTSSSKEFINKVNPKYCLISVGKNNRYGHPKKEVLNNLRYTKVYRTDTNGSIKIILNRQNYKIKTCVS